MIPNIKIVYINLHSIHSRCCYSRFGKVIWYVSLSVVAVYCFVQVQLDRNQSTITSSDLGQEIRRFGNGHSRLVPRDVNQNQYNKSNVSDRDKKWPNLVNHNTDIQQGLVNAQSPWKQIINNHDNNNNKQTLPQVNVNALLMPFSLPFT